MIFIAVTTRYNGKITVIIDNKDGVDLKWLGDIIKQNIPVVAEHRAVSVKYGAQTTYDHDKRETIRTGKWELEVEWEQVEPEPARPQEPDDPPF